jgi:hypothetical protein
MRLSYLVRMIKLLLTVERYSHARTWSASEATRLHFQFGGCYPINLSSLQRQVKYGLNYHFGNSHADLVSTECGEPISGYSCAPLGVAVFWKLFSFLFDTT